MPEFTISVLIKKPVEVVEQAFFLPGNMPCWTKNLVRMEVVSGKIGEAGSLAHMHYMENGRAYVLEDRLLSYERGKKIVSQVSGSGMIIRVETTFETVDNETRITLKWSGKGIIFPLNVILMFMGSKIKGSAQEELEMFKELVEVHGAVFPETVC